MRFVPYGQQLRDPDTDEFKGILGAAFAIRPADEGHISLTWVEFYGEKSLVTYSLAASHFRDSRESKKLQTKAAFAVGSVAETKAMALTFGKTIRVVHAPVENNGGHAELRRFSDEDRALLDALARDVFREHVMVTALTLT
jgi:hypothetical protein